MEWVERLNQSMKYIEEHLTDEIDYEQLGRIACNDEEQWKYFIAVSSTKESGGFEEYTVPASTWVIFSGTGNNQSIQELEQRIITEWLPASRYEYANAPDLEVYLNPDPQNAQYEVWISVVKKKE